MAENSRSQDFDIVPVFRHKFIRTQIQTQTRTELQIQIQR